MKSIQTPQLQPRVLAEHRVQNLPPEFRHKLSRQLGLLDLEAPARKDVVSNPATVKHVFAEHSVRGRFRGPRKALPLELAEWLEGPVPSDSPQGRGIELRRCHPCARRAQYGNPLGCKPPGVAKIVGQTGVRVVASLFSARACVQASHLSVVFLARHRTPCATSLIRTPHGMARTRPSSGRGRSSSREAVKACVSAPAL